MILPAPECFQFQLWTPAETKCKDSECWDQEQKGGVRWVSFGVSNKKIHGVDFVKLFFCLTISSDYKAEFTTLVATGLLHNVQLHLTRAGPVTRLRRWDWVQGSVHDVCAPSVSVVNIVLDHRKDPRRWPSSPAVKCLL